MAPPPVAVTFDFWDTLVRAPTAAGSRQLRHARLTVLFAELGVEVDGRPVSSPALDEALAESRRRFDEHWAVNEQFTGHDACDELLRTLHIELDDVGRRRAADEFIGTGETAVPELTAHVEATLRALSARGVKLGIICDVGLVPSTMLRGYLDRHGVLELFDHWSFSDDVGCYKPHPMIFEHALAGLGGIEPGRAAHVGDLRRTDVAGARLVGMTAVRYAGSNDDPGAPVTVPDEGDRARLGSSGVTEADAVEGDLVIHDHAELLGALGFDPP